LYCNFQCEKQAWILYSDSQFYIEKSTKDSGEFYYPVMGIDWIDVKNEMLWRDGWVSDYKNGFNFIDLFAGAGGLSCGLKMAGFNPVASVEINPYAVATYRRNFGENAKPIDIRLDQSELIESVKDKHIHLISGGFPCQGFSMAGKRIVTDPRNSLYLEMLKVVAEIKPDFVLCENVEGLRSMMDGLVEAKILEDYKNIGYEMNVTVLNSADYGVPQIRKRVIFIGNRLGKKNCYPQPILTKNEYKTVEDGISRFMNMPEQKHINHIFTRHNEIMSKKLNDLQEGRHLYENYADAWKRPYWSKPSPTVKECHGGVLVHPKLPRVMTPRELAALQSFPDDFIFEGSKKW